jgi:hypothetical protein
MRDLKPLHESLSAFLEATDQFKFICEGDRQLHNRHPGLMR